MKAEPRRLVLLSANLFHSSFFRSTFCSTLNIGLFYYDYIIYCCFSLLLKIKNRLLLVASFSISSISLIYLLVYFFNGKKLINNFYCMQLNLNTLSLLLDMHFFMYIIYFWYKHNFFSLHSLFS